MSCVLNFVGSSLKISFYECSNAFIKLKLTRAKFKQALTIFIDQTILPDNLKNNLEINSSAILYQ